MRPWLALGIGLLAAACGSTSERAPAAASGGSGGDGASGGSAGVSAGGAMAAGGSAGQASAGYPAGPYGTQAGDVLADLEMLGYVRFAESGLATQATFGDASFSAIRSASPHRHALIHVVGFT